MSIVQVPFNFKPSDTGREASSYTVPAGKYARVTINVYDGGIARLGGSEIMRSIGSSTAQDTTPVANTRTSSGTLRTVGTNEYFEGQYYIDCNTPQSITLTVGGQIVDVVSSGTSKGTIRAGEGQDIECDFAVSATGEVFLTGYEIDELVIQPATSETTTIWAKSGDVISIIGNGNIYYSEFNNIT